MYVHMYPPIVHVCVHNDLSMATLASLGNKKPTAHFVVKGLLGHSSLRAILGKLQTWCLHYVRAWLVWKRKSPLGRTKTEAETLQVKADVLHMQWWFLRCPSLV